MDERARTAPGQDERGAPAPSPPSGVDGGSGEASPAPVPGAQPAGRPPPGDDRPPREVELEAEEAEDEEDDTAESAAPELMRDPRRLAYLFAGILLAVVAIYILLPKVVGLGDALDRVGDAAWYWIVVAIVLNVGSFAAYVALFQGVLGGDPGEEVHGRLDAAASYQITMAGLAATRLFSAAGAGGIALTYWALRKAGMRRRRAACRMVAFLAVLYLVYLVVLVLCGVLLRSGALPGEAPVAGTILPAVIAGAALAVIGLVALIPGDVERRLHEVSAHPRIGRFSARVLSGPATVATGIRTAIGYVRHPSQGALALVGAAGYWGAQIGVLWASFKAFGASPEVGVLVQGFFLGMAANLIPSPAGGAGPVDAGMIGAFLLFGEPSAAVFPAVLTFRIVVFWLPIPPGVVAYFQLRRTVAQWDRGRGRYTSQSKVTAEAT